MSPRRHLSSFFVLFLLVALGCTAVPDEGVSQPPRNESSVPELLAFESNVDAVEPTIDDRDQGVRLALVEPDSWHPHTISIADRGAAIVADLLFDGLTEAVGEALVPALATSWSATDDLTTWTFVLDTERVGPAEVVASFQRPWAEQSTVATRATLDLIAEVRVAGDGTVVFDLVAPTAGFAWLLSSVAMSIADSDGSPTGRYAVRVDEDGIELGPEGAVAISIDWFGTNLAAQQAVRDDAADAALAPPAIQPSPGVSVLRSSRSISRFLVLNDRSPEVAGPARLAIAATLGQVALDAGSSAVGIRGLVPGNVAGAVDDVCDGACVVAEPTDGQFRRPLAVGGPSPDLLKIVSGELELAGIEAEVVVAPAAQLGSEIEAGTIDVFSSGWIGEAGSLDAWIPFLVGDDAGQVSDGALASALADAVRELDDTGRWKLLREVEQAMLGSGWVVPVAARADALLIRDGLAGFSINPDGTLRFELN